MNDRYEVNNAIRCVQQSASNLVCMLTPETVHQLAIAQQKVDEISHQLNEARDTRNRHVNSIFHELLR